MSKFMTVLVEDDAFQREVLADVLKEEGFEVVECATAEAAELIVASTGTELRALITTTISRGRCRGPRLHNMHDANNIILMSGTKEPAPAITTFLQKLFAPDQLLEAVRD